ncbi:hypothetical protein [Miltoncostaea marina]|uniref:hypothetical protein n=1 Tax=Miltoncostaea marina TaxID=2843215 RepID=UPI001C3D1452|nr:hypothetical protein [Miltoncostaea marina]
MDPRRAGDPGEAGRWASDDGREGPGVQPATLEGNEGWPDETGPADVAASEDAATPSP